MPFFYSQYLKDEKPRGGGGLYAGGLAGGGSGIGPRPTSRPTSTTTRTKATSGGTATRPASKAAGRKPPGRLVWHSGTGSSGKASKAQTDYKPLKYKLDGKKVVHFSTIEVQPFHFDWNLANDVFYTRAELTAMGQSRFDDAATLRHQRHLDEKGGRRVGQDGRTVDDLSMSTKSKAKSVVNLLSTALEDDDNDDTVSIRGIEHFVYPGLQQEMIRRKKEVQREVLDFVRSKKPDPQGWRLAQHSRNFSQWARNVALEKGMKYCMNNAAGDPDVVVSEDELQRFQKSSDELEASSRELRGSSSFSASFTAGSRSFDLESSPSTLQGIEECDKDEKEGGLNDSRETQTAGMSTGED